MTRKGPQCRELQAFPCNEGYVVLANDIYTSPEPDLNSVKTAIETAIGVRFTPHDSWYRGGTYFRFDDASGEKFLLQRNLDQDEVAEPEFAEFPVVLYVKNTMRSDQIASLLAATPMSITLVQHNEVVE